MYSLQKLRQEGVPSGRGLLEREEELEGGGRVRVQLDRAQLPAVLGALALETDVQGAAPQPAQFRVGQLEDVLRDLPQEAAGQQHLSAGEVAPLRSPELLLEPLRERRGAALLLRSGIAGVVVPV